MDGFEKKQSYTDLLKLVESEEIFYDFSKNCTVLITDPSSYIFYRTGQFYQNLFIRILNEANIKMVNSDINGIEDALKYIENFDYVTIIYVGHGKGNQSNIPFINKDGKPYNLHHLCTHMYSLGRLKGLTEVYDCCNMIEGGKPRYQPSMIFEGAKDFLKLKGHNIICSASRGNYSWYTDRHTLYFQAFESAVSGVYKSVYDMLETVEISMKGVLDGYGLVKNLPQTYFEIDKVNGVADKLVLINNRYIGPENILKVKPHNSANEKDEALE